MRLKKAKTNVCNDKKKNPQNIYTSGGPLSALTCCVNVRLLSAIKKISPLIYSQSWVGSWVYTTQAMMTFTLIVTKFVMEGRKRTGLAWEDSGEIYSDKLKQLRTLRALKTSTLSVVSAITLSIRFGCLPLTDRAPESSLRLSSRVPTPRWLY